MKATRLILVSVFTLIIISSRAQDYPLIPDHPGTFKLIDWGVYTHYNCGFTKTETTAHYQNLIRITDLVRKNPVFINQKGFDCETYVYAMDCPDKSGYGIPARLSFGFEDWYMSKGKPNKYSIEPPSWSVKVNTLDNVFGSNYSLGASKPSGTAKEGFNFEKWKSVSEKLHDCIYLPGQKEELGSGIDRYISEIIVVYNPEQPPYYLPVRFRELAELLIEYWRLHPDKYQSDLMTGMMETEYAGFSEAERNGWAYNNTYDERSPFLKITTIPGPQPVVRLNPEYWNRKLPKSAIQLLTFNRLTDTRRYTNQKDEWLKKNAAGYSLQRFLEAFDITTLTPAIDK